jgi:hypothetical protein
MPVKNNQLKLSDNPNINKTNTLPKSRGRSGNGHDANPPSIAKPPPKAKPKPPVAPPPSTSSLTPIILSTIATENPPNFFVLNTVDYTIPPGSQLTIGAKQNFYLSNNNFVNNGSFQILGSLTVKGGTFINNGNITTMLNSQFNTGGSSLFTSTLITNNATMKIGGFFSLGSTTTFTNAKTGTLTTTNTFYQLEILNNSGNFNINGNFLLNSGTINNNGNITNSANSNIQNNNTITNNIYIENLGTISNGSIINNNNLIYNTGKIINASSQGASITPQSNIVVGNQVIQQ